MRGKNDSFETSIPIARVLFAMGLTSWVSALIGVGARGRVPRKCFISHSYADGGAVESLCRVLPRNVEPFIFPPIKVPPDQRVSDDLVRAILGCEELIYLTSASSASSFWVSFEKHFALRAGLKVFAFDPRKRRIRSHRGKIPTLPVYPWYSSKTRKTVDEIARFMKHDRYLDLFLDQDLQPGSDFRRSIEDALVSRLEGGGYCVAFVSEGCLDSERFQNELRHIALRWPTRILPVLLEPVRLPDWLRRVPGVPIYREKDQHRREQFHPDRLNRERLPRIDWNRVDDVIVRIFHLVYQGSPDLVRLGP